MVNFKYLHNYCYRTPQFQDAKKCFQYGIDGIDAVHISLISRFTAVLSCRMLLYASKVPRESDDETSNLGLPWASLFQTNQMNDWSIILIPLLLLDYPGDREPCLGASTSNIKYIHMLEAMKTQTNISGTALIPVIYNYILYIYIYI